MPSLDPSGSASLDPLSWQFLFCLGLWTGQHFHRAGRELRARVPLQALCAAIVAAGLLSSLMDHAARSPLAAHLPLFAAMHELRNAVRAGPGEHFLRLLHFLAVAYLVASLLRATHPLLRSAGARPLVLTGQFALQSFCLGAVMSVLGSLYWQARTPGLWEQALATLLGCALLALLAMALAAGRGSRASTRAAASPQTVAPIARAGAVEA